MIPRVARPAFLAGLVLVVGTNLFIAAGVVRNRLGEPDARVVLTERELQVAEFWRQREEDSGLALHLRPRLDSFRLDRDTLREVGFNVEVAPADPRASLVYSKRLPHRALVVLEFEGESWTRWIAGREDDLRDLESQLAGGDATRQRLEAARQRLEQDRVNASRLFVVDVGRDGHALRRRYSEQQRYIVVPGVVRLYYRHPKDQPAELYGQVTEILVSRVHVPLPLRPVLDEAIAERGRRNRRRWQDDASQEADLDDLRPLYAATVAFGRRWEPVLEDVSGAK